MLVFDVFIKCSLAEKLGSQGIHGPVRFKSSLYHFYRCHFLMPKDLRTMESNDLESLE